MVGLGVAWGVSSQGCDSIIDLRLRVFGKPTRPRLLFQRLLNITDKNKRTPKNLGPTPLHCRGLFPSSDVDASKNLPADISDKSHSDYTPEHSPQGLIFSALDSLRNPFEGRLGIQNFKTPSLTSFDGLNNCTPTRIRDFQSCQTVTAIKAYSIQSTHSFWPDLRGSKSGLQVNAERTDEGDRVTTLQQEADFHYVVLPWIGGKYSICTIWIDDSSSFFSFRSG